MKTTHPVTRSALGIAALVLIAILANWLISLTPLGNRGIDFTEHKIHTLSDGTRAILKEISEDDTPPIVIRYYATRSTNYMPEEIKLHMRRVDDLLAEYASLSGGKIRIEHLDPEPDTEAEDSARLDGMAGNRINNENLYFGLSISCLDRSTIIPFLDPRDETMLEYQLSGAIAQVSTSEKPVIGILSGIELAGSPPMMPGQRPTPPWVIYQQIGQSYDVENLPLVGTTEIDPEIINALLVIHPAGIPPETEYAIDQYLLRGGTVIVCLDAFSIIAERQGGGNPMMGMPGVPTSSTLPTLLDAWGVSFESGQVLADISLATTRFRDGIDAIAVLTMPEANMPQKDSIVTQTLNSVTMYLPGAITRTGGAGVEASGLIISSINAGFVDGMRAAERDPSLAKELKPKGTAFDLATHITGKFRSAFPEGPPANEEEMPEEKPDAEHLAQAVETGNVFLIADVDMFADDFAYNVQNFAGRQIAAPSNGNSTFMLNLIDQAAGSRHLIGSRSRSAQRRPFTVITDMEAKFNREVGAKIEEFNKEIRDAEARLNEIQAQESQSSEVRLPAEIQKERELLIKNQIKYNRLIREQEIDLRRQKDRLAGNATLLNVAVMPLLVLLFGLGLYLKRRSVTRAR